MFAVCKINKKQYIVSEGEIVKIEKITEKEGKELIIKEILLVSNGEEAEIGQPTLEKVSIKAKVKGHGKNKKVTIFKYKKRKGYRKKQGHRQTFSEILIEKISGSKITPVKTTKKKVTKTIVKKKEKSSAVSKKRFAPKKKPKK